MVYNLSQFFTTLKSVLLLSYTRLNQSHKQLDSNSRFANYKLSVLTWSHASRHLGYNNIIKISKIKIYNIN